MLRAEDPQDLGERLVALMSCVEQTTSRVELELPSVDHLAGRWRCPEPAAVLSAIRTRGPATLVAPLEAWWRRLAAFDEAVAELTGIEDSAGGDALGYQGRLDRAIERARACRQAVEETAEALRHQLAAGIDSALGEAHRRTPGPGAGRPGPRGGPDAERVWSIEIVFTEDEDRTRADAKMHAATRDWRGWGRARRNPGDPDVPSVGEELAAARAIADLAHQLVHAAEHEVETFEGHPVHLHA